MLVLTACLFVFLLGFFTQGGCLVLAYFVAVAVEKHFLFNDFVLVDDFGFVLGFGVGAQFACVEGNGDGEVVFVAGYELVQNGARILVFALFFCQKSFAFFCEGVVATFATAGVVGIAVV